MPIIIEKIINKEDINICPLLQEEDLGKFASWEVECTEEELGVYGEAVLTTFESRLVDVFGSKGKE